MKHSANTPATTLARLTVFTLAMLGLFTLMGNLLPQGGGEPVVEPEPKTGALSSPAEMVALGERLFSGRGACSLCHNNLGRAPDILVLDMVELAGERLRAPDYRGEAATAAEYIRESMSAPDAYVVAGYGKKGSADALSPMPAAHLPPAELSDIEIDAITAFLQAKDGHAVTVSPRETTPTADSSDGGAPGAAVNDTPIEPESTEALMLRLACPACHDSPLAPPLGDVGGRLSAEAIRRAIIAPDAEIAAGFAAGIMPGDYAERLTVAELERLVKHLSDRRDASRPSPAEGPEVAR